MEEDSEPDSTRAEKTGEVAISALPEKIDISYLESLINDPNYSEDIDATILRPTWDKGEVAVLNPSLSPVPINGKIPFIYRSEQATIPLKDKQFKDLGCFDRKSVIKHANLESPVRLSKEKKIIIEPEYLYEYFGCEDPRLTRVNDLFYITYTGFSGLNANICLATTTDFKTIEKQGVIGPNMTLREAGELVQDPYYKEKITNDYKALKENFSKIKERNPRLFEVVGNIKPEEVLISDKDAILEYNVNNDKKWELKHRIWPWAQVAYATSISDLKEKGFWRNHFKNLHKFTKIKTKGRFNKSGRYSRHVGWGSTKFKLWDKNVELIHGADDELNYSGTLIETKKGNIVAMIQDQILVPDKTDTFIYKANGEYKIKGVIFPTGALVDEKADRLYIYSGSADQNIKMNSKQASWAYEQLDHAHNKIEVA
jgi:predicted GH43/DUF377 family glycosyl hydrolase